MKILIICGSTAEKSYTRAGLKYIQGLLEEKSIEVHFWDLKETPLPIVVPEYHKDPMQHPEKIIRDFDEAVHTADGIILGTPLYHGSYSGVLKNAIDNLEFDAFRNKPIGLLSNGSGGRGTAVPCEHLRSVVKTLYGYVTQTQVATGKPDFAEINGEFILQDDKIEERCVRLIDEMIQLAPALKNIK